MNNVEKLYERRVSPIVVSLYFCPTFPIIPMFTRDFNSLDQVGVESPKVLLSSVAPTHSCSERY